MVRGMGKLGKFILEELRKRNLSQLQFSTDLGVRHTTVGRWIRGSTPDLGNCIAIALYFDCDPEEIIQIAGPSKMLEAYRKLKARTAFRTEEEALIKKMTPNHTEQMRQLKAILEYGGQVAEGIKENLRVFYTHILTHRKSPH